MGTSPSPRSGRLWTETPELRVGPVARVALTVPVDKPYTFSIPDALAETVVPGKRVVVPFGPADRPTPAFCTAVASESWTSTLKPILSVLDEDRLIDDTLLALGEWIARYYACPLGRTLAAMVPEPIRSQRGFTTVRTCRLRPAPDEGGPPLRLSPKRRAILALLAAHPDGLDEQTLLEEAGAGRSVLTALLRAGRVEMTARRVPAPPPNFDLPPCEPSFTLTNAQQQAIARIDGHTAARAFRCVLLFGVSGSGKTEIYIRAIRRVLAQGRQAILLVPEIALTTQLLDRLASRFQDVAVIHSGLTGAARSLTWSAIASGAKRVVIGTRSAVFAPCPDLGLIVIDEEQESSYKNLQAPRFHTRDVAIKRAQLASIPVVLGSATPSLETWHNCERLAHFEKITLASRVGGLPMPEVEFVDMRYASRTHKGIQLLSSRSEHLLAEVLSRREQAIFLLNRRGYASYLVCARCRQPIVCPHCRVCMVFHKTTGKAMCNYCRARMVVPSRCSDPSCAGKLVRWGMGTQRVEEELRCKFPPARIARADSDTMHHARDYENLMRDLTGRKLDVLVGTQMIAKGLDFPSVSFVCVVNADTTLAVPDFRAAERTFQLVTQVAGRAGRASAGGRVIVQSLAGMNPALQCALRHDYESFVRHELAIRKRIGWPPFTRLARIVVRHRSQVQGLKEAQRLADAIRAFVTERSLPADVLGPQSAPLARLRNAYRFDLLIRAAHAGRLMDVIDQLRAEGVLKLTDPHTLIDVDPVELA